MWFKTLIKFFFLDYVSLNIEFNVFMKNDIMIVIYVNDWSDFYKIRSRDYLLIEKRFKQTIRNEWFKFVHLLFRHDDLQKSISQTIDSESECLRWTNVTRSRNVKLQIINHFYERFISSDKNFWRVYCWQKSQNQLSINREIIDVYHAKDSIEHNLFYFDD
jgi:hypothetical protein